MNKTLYYDFKAVKILLICMTCLCFQAHAKEVKNIKNVSNAYIQKNIFGQETLLELQDYYSSDQINQFSEQYKKIALSLPQDQSTKVKFFFCGDVTAFLTVMGGQGYACLGPDFDFYAMGGMQMGLGFELSAGLSLMVYWGDENFLGDYAVGRIAYSGYIGGQGLLGSQVRDDNFSEETRGSIVLAGARLGYGGAVSGSVPLRNEKPPLMTLSKF